MNIISTCLILLCLITHNHLSFCERRYGVFLETRKHTFSIVMINTYNMLYQYLHKLSNTLFDYSQIFLVPPRFIFVDRRNMDMVSSKTTYTGRLPHGYFGTAADRRRPFDGCLRRLHLQGPVRPAAEAPALPPHRRLVRRLSGPDALHRLSAGLRL